MAGSAGAIGAPVRVGRYQMILTGASFATRLATVDNTYLAEKGKKLLILNFTVQNPGKVDLGYDWSSIAFSVVGAGTDNFEYENAVFNPEKLSGVNVELKPAQKIPLIAFIQVPANDPIPKLIAKSENAPVVRYDLKGKVKKYTGPYASADGVTVLENGVGKLGEKAEAGLFDISVDKVEEASGPLGNIEAPEGRKLVVVSVTYTNPTKQDQALDWGAYEGAMVDANDESFEWVNDLLRGVGNEPLNTTLKPGQTVKGRMVFFASKDATPAKLTLSYGGGNRSLVYKLTP